MLKERLKLVITITIILLIIALIVTFVSNEISYLKSGIWEYDVMDFKKYKKYFQLIAFSAMELYSKYSAEYDFSYMTVILSVDEWEISFCEEVFDESKNKWEISRLGEDFYVQASSEEKYAYEKVREAFSRREFTRFFYNITVEKDRVTFRTISPYVVIYSHNNKKPHYAVHKNNSNKSIFVDRLAYKWYQVLTN